MSKKHYIVIAKVIAAYAEEHESLAEDIAGKLADAFQADNASFSRDRFLTACRVKAEA